MTIKFTPDEIAYLEKCPDAIALIMGKIDFDFCEWESMFGGPPSAWPPVRWTEMKEAGRAIVGQAVDCYPNEILRQFGFPEYKYPAPTVKIPTRGEIDDIRKELGGWDLNQARYKFAGLIIKDFCKRNNLESPFAREPVENPTNG